MLIYYINWKPFSSKLCNWIELMNEGTFLGVCYCFIFFTDNPAFRPYINEVGWTLIVITGINTLVNLVIILISTIKALRQYLQKRKLQKQY